MRVAYVNKSDDATLTASTTAGGLSVTNLQTVYKSEIWRSTTDTATLTVAWPTGKQVSVVCIPFSSLSSAAEVRIRCYTNAADASPIYDSGYVVAVPPITLGDFGWGSVELGVNAYAYGVTSTMVQWVPVGSYEKIVIDLDDSLNPLGYIEAGRLFVSSYYEFINNADFGSSVTTEDNSTSFRNDSSDLLTERGIIFRKLSLSLSSMREQDRVNLSNILKRSSSFYPVLVSIFPEDANAVLEQEYQIYGKLSKSSSIAISNIDRYASSIDIESV